MICMLCFSLPNKKIRIKRLVVINFVTCFHSLCVLFVIMTFRFRLRRSNKIISIFFCFPNSVFSLQPIDLIYEDPFRIASLVLFFLFCIRNKKKMARNQKFGKTYSNSMLVIWTNFFFLACDSLLFLIAILLNIAFALFASALIFIDFQDAYLSHKGKKKKRKTLSLSWFVSCWRNIIETWRIAFVTNGLTTCFRPFQDVSFTFFCSHSTKFPLFFRAQREQKS